MSAVLSLLQSRLLRPVFVTLGIALLVQVLVAVALTRSTVTALEADLGSRLGIDSQKLSNELAQAGNADGIKLIQVGGRNRQEAQTFQKWHTRVAAFIQNPPVESQPTELTVEKTRGARGFFGGKLGRRGKGGLEEICLGHGWAYPVRT